MFQNYLGGLLIVALTLAGCVSMPLTTMYKLHKIDPLEADPAQIKVAVATDKRIDIRADGASIELGFDAEDGSLHIDEVYVLEIVRDPIYTQELSEAKTPGKAIIVLQLSDNDARRMRQVQSQLMPFRNDDRNVKGRLGVSLSGVCMHSQIPAGKVLADIFLQTSDADGFFLLTRGLDLRERRNTANADLGDWPMCG